MCTVGKLGMVNVSFVLFVYCAIKFYSLSMTVQKYSTVEQVGGEELQYSRKEPSISIVMLLV